MLPWLHRHFVQPVVAAKRRSPHLRDLAWLERHQYESPETIAATQTQLLQQILRYAWEFVPYYQEVWSARGLHPDAVRTASDLAQFPILTKADIRAAGTSLTVQHLSRLRVRRKSTSGSTGVPLQLWLDERGAAWKTAITLRSDEWSGYRRGDVVAKVWGNPEYRHEGLRGRLRNTFVDRDLPGHDPTE